MSDEGKKRKITAWSFQVEKPFFVYFKKHYCPMCNELLSRVKVSRIVNSESEEAPNYDFNIADIQVKGNAKFSHVEFHCAKCDRNYTVKEQKENEILVERWK